MLVREVMTTPVHTVTPATSIREAIRILDSHAITAMPVVDLRGQPIGVVSEADLLLGIVAPDQRRHERPVSTEADPFRVVDDVMNRHPITVAPDTDLAEAVELMTSTAVKSLPVVDHGRVIGVVSRSDVIRTFARSDADIRAEVGELFREVEREWLADVHDGIVEVEGPETVQESRLASALGSTVPGVTEVRVKTTRQKGLTRRRS